MLRLLLEIIHLDESRALDIFWIKSINGTLIRLKKNVFDHNFFYAKKCYFGNFSEKT